MVKVGVVFIMPVGVSAHQKSGLVVCTTIWLIRNGCDCFGRCSYKGKGKGKCIYIVHLL